jgi:hypothetical protein
VLLILRLIYSLRTGWIFVPAHRDGDLATIGHANDPTTYRFAIAAMTGIAAFFAFHALREVDWRGFLPPR